jgi:hypothetical protein
MWPLDFSSAIPNWDYIHKTTAMLRAKQTADRKNSSYFTAK